MNMIKKVTLILILATVSSFASANVAVCKKNTMMCATAVIALVVVAKETLEENQGPTTDDSEQTSGPIVETLPVE